MPKKKTHATHPGVDRGRATGKYGNNGTSTSGFSAKDFKIESDRQFKMAHDVLVAMNAMLTLIDKCNGSWNTVRNPLPIGQRPEEDSQEFCSVTDLKWLKDHNLYVGDTHNKYYSEYGTPKENLDWTISHNFLWGLKTAYWNNDLFIPSFTVNVFFFKDNLEACYKKAKKKYDAYVAAGQDYFQKSRHKKTTGTTTTTTTTDTSVTTTNAYLDPIIYNVSGVKEAYYRDRFTTSDAVVDLPIGLDSMERKYLTKTKALASNSPSNIQQADELWNSAIGSKGMFVAYFSPDGFVEVDNGAAVPIPGSTSTLVKKYGFQFLYNPTTIAMDYSAIAATDVGFIASGQDKFNYYPSASNAGNLNFQIFLNRMEDMKYYTSSGSLTEEALALSATGPYTNRLPYGSDGLLKEVGLFNEQAAIYNKGTMYDMEYLLRTLLGFTMHSELRNEYTADMGIFTRKQVELHLGKSLRYRGFVNSVSIEHILFDERMVPVFSSVRITFYRFPDYPTTKNATSSNRSF
jgi:hypothetical protein